MDCASTASVTSPSNIRTPVQNNTYFERNNGEFASMRENVLINKVMKEITNAVSDFTDYILKITQNYEDLQTTDDAQSRQIIHMIYNKDTHGLSTADFNLSTMAENKLLRRQFLPRELADKIVYSIPGPLEPNST